MAGKKGIPGNTRYESGVITYGGIYAAGTTNFNAGAGSAATNLNTGEIKAAGTITAGTGLVAGTTIESGTTITAGSGFVFEAGNAIKFASGTYYGTGQASSAIVSSGLTTVTHVFPNVAVIGQAGTTILIRNGVWHWVTAEATVGSFYLRAVRRGSAGTIDEWLDGTGAACTVKWLAIGA